MGHGFWGWYCDGVGIDLKGHCLCSHTWRVGLTVL